MITGLRKLANIYPNVLQAYDLTDLKEDFQ